MASSYTSLLGLVLPVTGELSGNWGDIWNDSGTSLIDAAISGTTSLTTDADVTLTTTDGVANEARQAIILWNPASGTVTRNITAPARSKIYTVINASGGTQSIVFRGAGPTTGVTIIKGESAVVAWNGSDFIKISNTGGGGSFTNVTISGTTTLSGLTASTALALNSSKEVVSVTNTGTGNNVLSASPTLTGTLAAAAATFSGAVTLGDAAADNITVNGTVTSNLIFTDNTYDIGASGATRPRNLFLAGNATVGGNIVLTGSLDLTNLEVTNIKAKDGTAGMQIADSTGVVSFTANPVMSGGTANGVAYLNGSKVLTTGSALTFDGTNLGIGTSSPLSLFNIYGSNTTVYTGSGSTTSPIDDAVTLFVRNSSNTSGTMAMLQLSPTSSTGVTQHAYIGSVSVGGQFAPAIVIGQRTGSATWAERMRISSAGGLSIGTTTDAGAGGLNITGNAVLGDASTDTVQVNGYMGVGGAATSNVGLYLTNTISTGNIQYGIAAAPVGNGTNQINGIWSGPATAASSFTAGTVAAIRAANATKGAGSTITNLYGLVVEDQTQGTNNYGITSLVSSGTNKWNIYASGTAQNYFAGDVGIGTSTSLNASVNTSVSTTKAGYSVHSSGGSGATTGLMFSNTGSYGFIDYDPSSSSGVRFSAFGPLRFGSNTNAAYGSSTFTEAMRITGGNVGIGTSSPAYRLDVVESADSEVSLRVSNQNTGANSIASLYLQGQGNNFYIRNYGDGAASANRTDFISTAGSSYFTFSPTSAEAMRITSAGNVGIGTSSPVGNLDVAGTTPTLNIRDTQSKVSWAAGDIVATLDFYSNDTSGVGAQAVSRIRSVADTASAATSGALAFWTAAAGAAATEKLRITSAGNVGIGITTPTYALDVVGDIQAQGRLLVTAAAPELLLSVPSGGLDSRIYNDGSGNLIFGNGTNSATPTERMRIDSSGNVGIGVIPTVVTHGPHLEVGSTRGTVSIGTGYIEDNGTTQFFNGARPLAFGVSDTERMRLDASGNLGIGTSSPRSLLNPSGSGSTGAVLTLENSNTALTTGNVIGEIDFYANDASTNGTGAKAKIVSVIENSAGNLVSLTFATSDSTSATGVERMRLDSAGNLGLGVTPSAWGSTSTALQNRNASFWATSAAAYLGYNYFFDGSARKYIASSFATEYTQLNGQHIWYTAPSGTAGNAITFTQAMTLDASGNLGIGTNSPAVKLDVSGQIRASTGILFGTDTAAANALDDYEEGTFTPTIIGTTTAGTGTYSSQVGRYTKIGNRVYFSVAITWSAHTGTGNMKISGLPFTSVNTASGFNFLAVGANNLTYTSQLTAFVDVNATTASMATFASAGALTSLAIDTAATVYVSGHYEV